MTELTGYRIWKTKWNDVMLPRLAAWGRATKFEWLPGDNRAVCDVYGAPGLHEHVAIEHCSCGFWAFNSAEMLASEVSWGESGVIAGEVQLWGRVQKYSHGYRAEYARVSAIYAPNRDLYDFSRHDERDAIDVAHAYNVPLKSMKIPMYLLGSDEEDKWLETQEYRVEYDTMEIMSWQSMYPVRRIVTARTVKKK